MEKTDFKKMLPKIDRKRHKYQAGLVIGLAGSPGMYGAAKLSSLAALRSGCGIVKVISEKEIPSAFYELVNCIISFDNTDAVPLGLSAALETPLVNSAPA